MKKLILFTLITLRPVFLGAQIVTTIAGTGTAGYFGDSGPASSALLNSPDAVKFDNAGNLYIADEYNHVIRKISTSGIITSIAGTGIAGKSGDNGPATNAQLKRPIDLAFDNSGNLYIAEYGNKDIRKISTAGVITTIAGTGTAGYNGDNMPATSAQINDPIGIIFDNKGDLYFSDNANYRIRKIDHTTGIITTVVGTGTAGYTGDNGPASAAQIRLTGYLCFSPAGELFFGDYSNHVIRKLNAAGIITTVAGTGVSGHTGDDGPASAATFVSPSTLLFDNAGNIFISDRVLGVIRRINTSSIVATIAGLGTVGYGGDGGMAIAAQFNTDVNCSAIDAAGNLYIADPLNNRIRKITNLSAVVHEVNAASINVTIYPNPAHTLITINADTKIERVQILNAIGQEVIANAPNTKGTELDIRHLPAGLYFVKVNGVYGGRFVKE